MKKIKKLLLGIEKGQVFAYEKYSLNTDESIVKSSDDANDILHDIFKKEEEELGINFIERQEVFYVLLLNRRNRVTHYHRLSTGSTAGVVVDNKFVLQAVLATNSTGIIVSHNHPSNNLQPSSADISMTKKLKDSCLALDVSLLDHLITTPNKYYYSFADEGLL